MWSKLADDFFGHPKVLQTPLAARGLWVTCASWSARYDTDGYVPDQMIRTLGGTPRLTASLIDAGLWEHADGGVRFHDWHDYNPTADQRALYRAGQAERQRNFRAKKRRDVI